MRQLIEKHARLYTIDAVKVARESGMGSRINTIMQVCFFELANVMPPEEALEAIRTSIRKTYASKGESIIEKNLKAVDQALSNLHEVPLPKPPENAVEEIIPAKMANSEFVRDVLAEIIAGRGDDLPVSSMPCDGTFPLGTTKWEKRNIALDIPVWDPVPCIQCGKCAMVCPHAAIRIKVYDEALKGNAPETFKSLTPIHKDWKGLAYTIQVAPEDCTGCQLCTEVCPAKSKTAP